MEILKKKNKMHENGQNFPFTVLGRKIKKKSFIVRFRPGTINADFRAKMAFFHTWWYIRAVWKNLELVIFNVVLAVSWLILFQNLHTLQIFKLKVDNKQLKNLVWCFY